MAQRPTAFVAMILVLFLPAAIFAVWFPLNLFWTMEVYTDLAGFLLWLIFTIALGLPALRGVVALVDIATSVLDNDRSTSEWESVGGDLTLGVAISAAASLFFINALKPIAIFFMMPALGGIWLRHELLKTKKDST